MKLDKLGLLLETVQLTGSMPKPFLNMNPLPCIRKSHHQSSYAHCHANFGVRNRGMICFTAKGLDRPDYKVVHTLGHELAHLRFPRRAHRNAKFILAVEEFYLILQGRSPHVLSEWLEQPRFPEVAKN